MAQLNKIMVLEIGNTTSYQELGHNKLFLFQPIDMEQLFKPKEELIQFMKQAGQAKNTLIQKRQIIMQNLTTSQTT